jgi:PAS domain S-box-containing protein
VVVGVDLHGRVTFLSPSARTVLGHEPALSVGRSVLDFMHPEEVHRFEEFFGYATDGLGSSAQPTVQVRHADGSWVPMTLDVMAGPEVAPFGAVIGTLKTIGAAAPAELELRARLAREDRLVRLASTFLGLDLASFDQGVQEALAQLGGLPGVDRCTVMRLRDGRVVKTHQWCGRRAKPSARHEVPLEWLEGRFGPAWRDDLYFETADHLDDSDIVGLQEMDDDGIRSTLAVPCCTTAAAASWPSAASRPAGCGSEVPVLLRSAAGLLGEALAATTPSSNWPTGPAPTAHADRQPVGVPRRGHRRARAAGIGRGGCPSPAPPRPRPLQAGQRLARAPHRRPGAGRRRPPPAGRDAAH